jgi:hypothetical protein
MMRTISVVFALLGVGLLGYAGYRWANESDVPPGAALVVDEPERDLGEQPCEVDIPLRFRIRNVSSRPVRVVGLVAG